MSEVLLAFKSGIGTIKERHLDSLYESYDDESSLADQDEMRTHLLDGFKTVAEWEWIRSTALIKPYHLTLIILAVVHAQSEVPALKALAPGSVGLRTGAEIEAGLGELVRALEISDLLVGGDVGDDEVEASEDTTPDAPPKVSENVDPRVARHVDFVKASSSKTNTESARKERFLTFYAAIAKHAR